MKLVFEGQNLQEIVRLYVYNHTIQRSSSLKPRGQSKSNFIGGLRNERGTNVIINNPGYMTKMAAMPIYGKKPSKSFFTGTAEPIALKTDR